MRELFSRIYSKMAEFYSGSSCIINEVEAAEGKNQPRKVMSCTDIFNKKVREQKEKDNYQNNGYNIEETGNEEYDTVITT